MAAATRCARRCTAGCFGCFGPSEAVNADALHAAWCDAGAPTTSVDPVAADLQRRRAGIPDAADDVAVQLQPRPRRWATMTHDYRARRFQVEALTRVEGEGGLIVEIRDGELADVRLRIFEPPRFFEAFLRGRAYTEPPDITARICGICPVAYQMSACQALEAACGVEVDDGIRDAAPPPLLRRVDREPCAAHPPAPRPRLPRLPERHRDGGRPPRRGRTRAAAQEGRQPHRRGGRRPRRPSGERARSAASTARRPWRRCARSRTSCGGRWTDAIEVARWVATFPMPDHELPDGTALVALRHPTEYPMLGERLVSTGGLDIGVDEFPDHFAEVQVEHSTALHGQMLAGGDYLVGPLARFALNADHLAPRAAALAAELGLTADERNPFRSIVVRAIETVHACEVACAIAEAYTPPSPAAVPVEPRAGIGCGWSEAPRGSALAPLRDRRRGPCRRSTDRAADVAEPAGDRTRSRPPHRPLAAPRRCRTRGRSASRPCATTTRASRAPPTSSTCGCTGHDSVARPSSRSSPSATRTGATTVSARRCSPLVGESLGPDASVRLAELDGEPVRMMQAWEGSSTVWIVDATSSDRPPGSLHELDAARLGE